MSDDESSDDDYDSDPDEDDEVLTLAANNLAKEDEKHLTRQRWAVAMSPY
jgi:hypothetical protein